MIFQSTLRRTERLGRILKRIHLVYFNPRSGERSDLFFVQFFKEIRISIHAPANGATTFNTPNITTHRNFNPRSGERSDTQAPRQGSKARPNFNPRSGERSDAVPLLTSPLCIDFNPRSGERSDLLEIDSLTEKEISIHAPANGAT